MTRQISDVLINTYKYSEISNS